VHNWTPSHRPWKSARARLKGHIAIDYVVPDYQRGPSESMQGGWARRFMNVSPAGKVLPCHAAETLSELEFIRRDGSLAEIWRDSPAFQRFRGTAWMQEPCRSCERREIDWGAVAASLRA